MESIVIIAIFWPPIAVFIEYGFGKELGKNILLTLLGFYPGVIHALGLVCPGKNTKNVA
jgi:uncharacterized membrane protein YqaE (UPF0057 family)